MIKTRLASLMALSVTVVLFGCGPKGIAGVYRIEQDGAGFGEGAEKIELSLREDKTFDITAGPMKMAEGTWKQDGEKIILSDKGMSAAMGTDYKIKDGKLMPVIDGKDVTFWRWILK